eukprot:3754107-Amphidinium_carterae.1
MGNTFMTRRNKEKTESTVCSKRIHTKGQHRRDLRSNSSSNYIENATDIGTTMKPQHLHVRHTISISQHT